jgi:hypothetical protein
MNPKLSVGWHVLLPCISRNYTKPCGGYLFSSKRFHLLWLILLWILPHFEVIWVPSLVVLKNNQQLGMRSKQMIEQRCIWALFLRIILNFLCCSSHWNWLCQKHESTTKFIIIKTLMNMWLCSQIRFVAKDMAYTTTSMWMA